MSGDTNSIPTEKQEGNTITSVDKDEIHEATQYIMNQPDMEDDDSKNMSP